MAYGTVNVGQGKSEDIPVYVAYVDYWESNATYYLAMDDAPNIIENPVKKFAIDLYANYAIADKKITSNIYLYFGENSSQAPTHSVTLYKRGTSSTSNTGLRARDLSSEGIRYYFEWSSVLGSYICVNPVTLATQSVPGVGSAINNLNTEKYIQGEMLSAYQGRVLKDMIDAKPEGKRTCRFVVGTSTAGWTAADVDYLCDGVDDQIEIQAAIDALPKNGGEIIILDGEYIISASITCNKNIYIHGSGMDCTILKRNFSNTIARSAIIRTYQKPTKISDLSISTASSFSSNDNSDNIGIFSCDILVHNVSIMNQGVGIRCGEISDITSCYTNGNDIDVYVEGGNFSMKIVDNCFMWAKAYSVYIEANGPSPGHNICSSGGALIASNFINNSSTGIYCDEPAALIVGNSIACSNTMQFGNNSKECVAIGNVLRKTYVDSGKQNYFFNNQVITFS